MIVRSASHRPDDGWSGRHLAFSFAAVLSLTWVCRLGAAYTGPLAAVWLGTAVVLGILILVPRRWLLRYAVTLGISIALGLGTTSASPAEAASSAVINILAASAAAAVMRRDRAWVEGTSERIGSWLTFTVGGVLLPFLAGAALQSACRQLLRGGEPHWELIWSNARTAFITTTLAAFLIVPMMVRLRPAHLQRAGPIRGPELAGLLALLAALTVGAMAQPQPVLLFLLPVPLVVLAIRHGTVGATAGALVLAPIVLGVTTMGEGPFVLVGGGDEGIGLLWAQLFMSLLLAANLTIVALLDEQRSRGSRPVDRPDLFRLLAENSGDIVTMIDSRGRLRYVSTRTPADRNVTRDELIGRLWTDWIHPDDRPHVDDAAAALQAGADSATCLCRIRHRDRWRWFDIRLRATPDTGSDRFMVMVARDVTRERRRVRELQQQNLELEAVAGTDVLTGLRNRRGLATVQAAAWAEAVTAREPLSLLVLDIDHFKSYNDRYGHARGDRAIVAVSAAIRAGLRRPDDVAARYGGEEFVVLLPHTDAAGARRVAESLCEAVRACHITHGGSDAGFVTVSIGVATTRPTGGADDGRLFGLSDAALYRAKRCGRDRVEVAASHGGHPADDDHRNE